MAACRKCIQYFLSFTLFFLVYAKEDRFFEELYIKPLPNNHVYSYFQFTTLWDKEISLNPCKRYRYVCFLNFTISCFLDDHCHLFPRALGEILSRYQVDELHISLTGGLWRHEVFGYPTEDAAPGAEIRVWFQNGTTE